jgi:hypothetical protein
MALRDSQSIVWGGTLHQVRKAGLEMGKGKGKGRADLVYPRTIAGPFCLSPISVCCLSVCLFLSFLHSLELFGQRQIGQLCRPSEAAGPSHRSSQVLLDSVGQAAAVPSGCFLLLASSPQNC